MSNDAPTAPRILQRSDHPISRKAIHPDALKVLYRLSQAGYVARLVGGSVRDLMLGRTPKDFDLATNARPNEIRRLFRNSRVIGRRFRLVHVLFHDHVVEVATFRREPEPSEQRGKENGNGESDALLITSDNTFGSPEQDAFRRDFTINALSYDISDFSVLDWTGGVDDLERRVLRTIGDPLRRFREDPVRMLRACELAGRLGFGMDDATQAAIHELRHEVEKASPARLTEELIELLRCGHSGASLQWMLDLGLLEPLLPEAYAMVQASARG
ncbi:MAG: polynucleotide adenylyltransferase PcnB, partial [Myxococcota bacterium]